jgi:hypothetical protein
VRNLLRFVKSFFEKNEQGNGICICLDAPDVYWDLSQQVQDAGFFCPDYCDYTDDDGVKHCFVAGRIEVPMDGTVEPMLYRIWAEVHERDYIRHERMLLSPDESDLYFGKLSNLLPYYPDTLGLKVRVHPRKGRVIPVIEIEEYDHPLSVDVENGISVQRAQEIYTYAEQLMAVEH